MKKLANVIYWTFKTTAIVVGVAVFVLMIYGAWKSSEFLEPDWAAMGKGAAVFVVVVVLVLVYCWADYRRRYDA